MNHQIAKMVAVVTVEVATASETSLTFSQIDTNANAPRPP
jgi:hypothetical protein